MESGLVQGIGNNARARLGCVGIVGCAAALLVGLSAPSAHGAATIGQLHPGNPVVDSCGGNTNFELIQPTVATGPAYVVPAGGVAITSWSTKANPGAGQVLRFKLWRKVAEPATYRVVAQDGPRTLTPGVLNTFPVNLPAQPGDVMGMTIVLDSADTACIFDSLGSTPLTPPTFGDFAVGETSPFEPDIPDTLLNLSAVVGFKASNDIEFVKVKKNKNNGTATLTVDVPGPGQLSLKGPGVKPQRVGGATVSKQVTEAGKVKLRIKAKGAKKSKLLDTGKVKVKVKVTFKPSATGGDVAGDPNTDPKTIKLIDN